MLLIVEIVSPGSIEFDRHLKPVGYAHAGIPRFWRVERDGPVTVHMFGHGVGSDGTPVYVPRGAQVLEDLLAGGVPGFEES